METVKNLEDLPPRWLQWVRNRLYLREGLKIFTVDQTKKWGEGTKYLTLAHDIFWAQKV